MASRSTSTSTADPASTPDHLLELGRIVKAHGLRGEVVVAPITNVAERFEPGSELIVGGVTLRVASSRRHQQRLLVRFEDVSDRTAAEAMLGRSILAAALLSDEPDADEPFVHELIGLELVELDGTSRGRVEAVQSNPAADLLVLEDGALVPVTFVVAIGEQITIDAPAGLFEL